MKSKTQLFHSQTEWVHYFHKLADQIEVLTDAAKLITGSSPTINDPKTDYSHYTGETLLECTLRNELHVEALKGYLLSAKTPKAEIPHAPDKLTLNQKILQNSGVEFAPAATAKKMSYDEEVAAYFKSHGVSGGDELLAKYNQSAVAAVSPALVKKSEK